MIKINPSDYVIGTGKKTKLIHILKKIFKIQGLKIKKNLKINKKYFRTNEIISNCANVKKLSTTFNGHPSTKVDKIIQKFLNNEYY